MPALARRSPRSVRYWHLGAARAQSTLDTARLNRRVTLDIIEKIDKALRSHSGQGLWTIIRLLSSTLLDYWLRCLTPKETEEAAKTIDAALLEGYEHVTKVGATTDDTCLRRIRQPARSKGGGLRARTELRHPAYIAGQCSALSRFTDTAGGLKGFYPASSAWLGADSFDGKRASNPPYKMLLDGGGHTADALKTAWGWCQEHSGQNVAGYANTGRCNLEHSAEDMLGSSVGAGAQKALTDEIEKYQMVVLEVDIRALDRKDLRRVSFLSEDFKHSTQRVTALVDHAGCLRANSRSVPITAVCRARLRTTNRPSLPNTD